MKRTYRALAAASLALSMSGRTSGAAELRPFGVLRADDSKATVSLFDRAQGATGRVLLVVAGSDCREAKSQRWIGQVLAGAAARWVALVEKDGASPDGSCGSGYEAHATEESRWFDTIAAMRALKSRLHLNDSGAFQVLAISAGGLTGCAVAGATSDVSALALLSTGGGLTFRQELAVVDKDHPRILEQEAQVAAHPQIGRTWLGDTNPEIWWWSALPKRCLPLLAGFYGKVLVEQGEKDDAVPPESALALVDGLKRQGTQVRYISMPTGHDLGLASLPPEKNGVANALEWLASNQAPPGVAVRP